VLHKCGQDALQKWWLLEGGGDERNDSTCVNPHQKQKENEEIDHPDSLIFCGLKEGFSSIAVSETL
jgi:hypothetical protein